MKRLNTTLLAVFLASSLISVVPATAQGSVDPSAYAIATASLVNAGVLDGGGNVRLNEYVNRAEALKIILLAQPSLAAQIEQTKSSLPATSLFPDVSQTQWYAPYVEVGFRNGLIQGYSDGRLWPQAGVKVAEAAAMIVRSYGEQNSMPSFATSTDLPNQTGQWYTDSLSVINARSAVMPGSQLSAANLMTRGQLIDMVYRMRQIHLTNQTTFSDSTTPTYSVNGGGSGNQVATGTVGTSNAVDAQFASKKDFAITIPSIGIVDLTVTHPSDPYSQKGVLEPLQTGVGHLFSYPGNGGKVMIYGHSSGYPWDLSKFTKIFRTVNQVAVGSKVYVTYKGSLYVYQVTEKKTVPAKDLKVFEPDSKGEELILYTCWPPDSITNRYLIYASPVSTIALK